MDTLVMELGAFAVVCAIVGFATAWAIMGKRREAANPVADFAATKRLQRRLRELDRENRLKPRPAKRNS